MKSENLSLKGHYKNCKRSRQKAKPVTICIGTICEERKKAIIVSDRMITDEDLAIQFEHPQSKILPLSNNCVAVTSGSAFFFQEILDSVIAEFKNKSPKISYIAEKVAESYSNLRKKKLEEVYFKPMGLTIEKFNQEQINLQKNSRIL